MTKEQEEAVERLSLKSITSSSLELNDYPNMICLKKDVIEVLSMLKEKDKDIAKKDRIIDKMAMAIGDEPLSTEKYCVFRNFDCPVVGGNRECKNCVKQYFERKVEE